MIKYFIFMMQAALLCLIVPTVSAQQPALRQTKYRLPILQGKSVNPVIGLRIDVSEPQVLEEVFATLGGSLRPGEINNIQLYAIPGETIPKSNQLTEQNLLAASSVKHLGKVSLRGQLSLKKGSNFFCISVSLNKDINLSARARIDIDSARINARLAVANSGSYAHRLGIALRQHQQDGIYMHRIPGLATANDGSLLAIYDVRHDSARDLQGDIDIGLSRSTDKGKTWEPLQIVMDMGSWGGLPEKFNGVSDANILVDRRSGNIFIAGLWMHGVINEQGKWLEGLNEDSKDWNHQWKSRGSQPGHNERQTAQFMIVKSTDNGKTWTKPTSLTGVSKPIDWWLWAPAPGQGITLRDGTLVIPTQGRDEKGRPFSNLTYSKDAGKTWKVSRAAATEATTENMAVELSDGSIMLNMRANTNRTDTSRFNGRAVALTKNLGQDWQVHPSSHYALPEPTCMASIIRHDFMKDGRQRSMLLFSNPDSKTTRHKMTVKMSFDDGKTWPTEHSILLDELKSRGYSCMTSIDEHTIGILYESSQADLVFQTIELDNL